MALFKKALQTEVVRWHWPLSPRLSSGPTERMDTIPPSAGRRSLMKTAYLGSTTVGRSSMKTTACFRGTGINLNALPAVLCLYWGQTTKSSLLNFPQVSEQWHRVRDSQRLSPPWCLRRWRRTAPLPRLPEVTKETAAPCNTSRWVKYVGKMLINTLVA